MKNIWNVLGVITALTLTSSYAGEGGVSSFNSSAPIQNQKVNPNPNSSLSNTNNSNLPVNPSPASNTSANSPVNSANLKPVNYIDSSLLVEISKSLKEKNKNRIDKNSPNNSSLTLPPMIPFADGQNFPPMYIPPSQNQLSNLKVAKDVKTCDNKEIKVREYYCKGLSCYIYIKDKWLTVGNDLDSYKIFKISDSGDVTLICK